MHSDRKFLTSASTCFMVPNHEKVTHKKIRSIGGHLDPPPLPPMSVSIHFDRKYIGKSGKIRKINFLTTKIIFLTPTVNSVWDFMEVIILHFLMILNIWGVWEASKSWKFAKKAILSHFDASYTLRIFRIIRKCI